MKKNTITSYFSGQMRAQDGIIATFKLPDGSLQSEHFNQLVFTRGPTWMRTEHREPRSSIERAAARADELSAKIVCVSSPQSTLTDLQGTRATLEATAVQERPADQTVYPEAQLLGRIGRLDLFEPPTDGQNEQNIQQVRQRRSSTVGPKEQ